MTLNFCALDNKMQIFVRAERTYTLDVEVLDFHPSTNYSVHRLSRPR